MKKNLTVQFVPTNPTLPKIGKYLELVFFFLQFVHLFHKNHA